jgi:hypothetical protein
MASKRRKRKVTKPARAPKPRKIKALPEIPPKAAAPPPRGNSGASDLHDKMLAALKNTYQREVMAGNRDRQFVQQIAAVILEAEK